MRLSGFITLHPKDSNKQYFQYSNLVCKDLELNAKISFITIKTQSFKEKK